MRAVTEQSTISLMDARRHVLVTGGTGIAAGRTLAQRLAERGATFRVVHALVPPSSRDPHPRLAQQIPRDAQAMPDVITALEGCEPGTVVWCFGPTNLVDAVAQAHAFLPFLGPLRREHHDAVTVRPEVGSTTRSGALLVDA